MTNAISRGLSVYQEWHDSEPDELFKIPVNLPKEVRAIGKGVIIAYRSDKWHPGWTEDYEHDHDANSPPTIYHKTGDGRSRWVDSLLKNDVIIDLGDCIELIGKDADNDPIEFAISESRRPRLVCTSDKRTLIILHKDGPIFLNGGKLKVTDRGIEG